MNNNCEGRRCAKYILRIAELQLDFNDVRIFFAFGGMK